jgi:hypothetical protein
MLAQEPRRECSKLAKAARGTMVQAEPERSFARAWMRRKTEFLPRRAPTLVQVKMTKVAKALELLAER